MKLQLYISRLISTGLAFVQRASAYIGWETTMVDYTKTSQADALASRYPPSTQENIFSSHELYLLGALQQELIKLTHVVLTKPISWSTSVHSHRNSALFAIGFVLYTKYQLSPRNSNLSKWKNIFQIWVSLIWSPSIRAYLHGHDLPKVLERH